MLPDEQPSPEQIAIWRKMSGEQRLGIAESLCKAARKWKAAGVREQHPDWSDEQVNAEVRRMFSRADPEFFFESILPMLTACGKRFERTAMVEWLRQCELEW